MNYNPGQGQTVRFQQPLTCPITFSHTHARVLRVASAQDFERMNRYAWEAYSGGQEVSIQAAPSQAEHLHKCAAALSLPPSFSLSLSLSPSPSLPLSLFPSLSLCVCVCV